LTLDLSTDGAITSVRFHGLRRSVSANSQLAGCTTAGAVVRRPLATGVEFERQLACGEHRATQVDRYVPTPEGVRWEIEIRGEGAPWSTSIETRLRYPATAGVKFWTAWADPAPSDKNWRDPLVMMPPSERKFYYGAPPFDKNNNRLGYIPSLPEVFSLPLATFAEPASDAGLSVVLSPADLLLDLTLDTAADGSLVFSRLFHRIGAGQPVCFTLDLVPHEADWRGGLRFMVSHYPTYFNPVNPIADEMAGTAAYASSLASFDAAKMRRMAFRTNWMASFDFPYMGLFIPPVGDDEMWDRFSGDSGGEYTSGQRGRNGRISISQMASYSLRMREEGFYVLNYFNVTEFGEHIAWPPQAKNANASADAWQDASAYLQTHFDAAMLRQPDGKPYFTWGGAVAMDPGDPAYQAFLLKQARLHLQKFPASSGLCIDRMDWLRLYNPSGDDGVSWFDDRPTRSLVVSWHELIGKLAPELHASGKVLFCNNHTKRVDLLRDVDGIFDEFTYMPTSLNTTSLLGLRKPMLGWTSKADDLRPDPDAYFQRHLHLGVFPMAPFPGNDHSIAPGEWVDRQYLDYGPLLDALRGKKWVLTPHAVTVEGDTAKANLFETPGGYVVPVTFGGTATEAVVTLRGIRAGGAKALTPGASEWVPVKLTGQGELRLTVPLRRGCAIVRLETASR
jgi:hypothetical protein